MSDESANPVKACIGVGSNLGNRRAHLEYARRRLSETRGVRGLVMSDPVETAPVGGPLQQEPFYNAAILLETTLRPRPLLDLLLEIERERGRVRREHWGPRTLDLDLLFYGDQLIDEPGLQVPHPRFAERRFVLEPLAQIAPDYVDPRSGQTVSQLLASLGEP